MHRSIELGRAVLSTPAVNLELWLRTLITISQQQQCIDLEQHDAASLLSILSSGKVWVGQGNGLFIDLVITFKNQPVADEQLRHLSEAILHAPVWKQLNLQLSLPPDVGQMPGKVRVTVTHASDGEAPTEKQRHQPLPGASAADFRPPEGIPSLSLVSVLLFVDIFELPERTKVATGKRLKVAGKGSASQSEFRATIDDLEREPADNRPLDAVPTISLHAHSSTLKRARKAALPGIEVELSESRTNLDIGDLKTLIDGALRISVLCRINSKLVPGIKVKANTFHLGLADIAPILWKPGYLSSLSQRANLVSVIGRSLCRTAAITSGASSSFKKKMSAIAMPLLSLQSADQVQGCEHTSSQDANHLAPNIGSRVWLHLQRNAPCKAATVLQCFVLSGMEFSFKPQTDEMLEDSQQEPRIDHRPSLLTVDLPSDEESERHRTLKDCHAIPVSSYWNSAEHYNSGPVITPDHNSRGVGNELLLDDQCIGPLDFVTYPKNEIS